VREKMSTSFRSRAAGPAIEEPQDFIYRPVDGSKGLPSAEPDRLGTLSPGMLWSACLDPNGDEECPRKYTEDDIRAREKQSWEAGLREGENLARVEFAQAVAAERTKVNLAIANFQQEMDLYYQRAEGEVVRLSLAIARKILHREAQVDPLVLTAVARVALEKISSGSKVRLCVPAAEVSKWQEALAASENLRPQPEVVADATLSGAQLILQTEVGTADLSLEAQLKEIEQGFLDLLALRPSQKQ
jgi:flagellar assembly protein FliH